MTIKKRIAIKPNEAVDASVIKAGANLPVMIVGTGNGAVSTLDKLKGYYKGIIAVITAALVIANELTPVLNFLPGQDKQYVTAAIAAAGGLLAFFKDNEHWVDDL